MKPNADTRVTDCIAGDKASDATLCKNAIANNVCIRNPFTPECSTETVARDKRKEFCDVGNNATNTLCRGAVLHFCAIDPFDDLCDNNGYSQQQSERVALCISGDNASNDVLCMGAIADAVATDVDCITDPYVMGCESKLTARAARESYCRAGNENNGLCAGAVAEFCTIDPYDDLCNMDNFAALTTARGNRVTACIADDKANDDALCANAIKDDGCILDPYATDCESQDHHPNRSPKPPVQLFAVLGMRATHSAQAR